MVVCQSDVHHWADDDLSMPDNWPLENTMHSKDGGLRRVDDWECNTIIYSCLCGSLLESVQEGNGENDI